MMQLLLMSQLFGGRGFGGANNMAVMMLNPQLWMMGKLFRKPVTAMDAIIASQAPQLGMLLLLSKPQRRRRRRRRYYRRSYRRRRY